MRLGSSLRHDQRHASMGTAPVVLVFLLAVVPSLHAAIRVPEYSLEGTAAGDSSSVARDQPQAAPAAAAGPQIEFTSVPPYGSPGPLQGRVTGATAKDHAVAVYIHIPPAGWWTRPTAAAPVTALDPSGTWTCSLATTDRDQFAIEIVAFLIPLAYAPPVLDAALSLPEALYTYPYAQAIRYPRLQFANCDWMIKRVNDLIGPGPNYFTDNSENLWLDESGQLHLKLTQRGVRWYCSEGIAFYVWPEGRQPPGTCPVHRFRSAGTGSYFYTATESEKDKLVKEQPKLWTYEGVAWHAYRLPVE